MKIGKRYINNLFAQHDSQEVFVAVRYDFDKDDNRILGAFLTLDLGMMACEKYYEEQFYDPELEKLNWIIAENTHASASINECCNGGWFEVSREIVQCRWVSNK